MSELAGMSSGDAVPIPISNRELQNREDEAKQRRSRCSGTSVPQGGQYPDC